MSEDGWGIKPVIALLPSIS